MVILKIFKNWIEKQTLNRLLWAIHNTLKTQKTLVKTDHKMSSYMWETRKPPSHRQYYHSHPLVWWTAAVIRWRTHLQPPFAAYWRLLPRWRDWVFGVWLKEWLQGPKKKKKILVTSKTNKTTEVVMRSKGLNRSTRWDKNRCLDSSHISVKHFLAVGRNSTQILWWSQCHSYRIRPRIKWGVES